MKQLLLFFWRFPRRIFLWINAREEEFLQQFDENYKSKLALHSLIYNLAHLAIFFVTSLLVLNVISPICIKYNINNNVVDYIAYKLPLIALNVAYMVLYLRPRLAIIKSRKWWYCIQVIVAIIFGAHVMLLPIYILVGAIYLLVIGWLIYLLISSLCGIGEDDGRRKWKLNDGEEVTEHKGILGEKFYRGTSGMHYKTDDDGKTFYKE